VAAPGSTEDSAWRAVFDEATGAFPGVAVDFERFRAHAAAVGAPEPAGAPRATDLFLACACAAGDEKAIALLEQRYLGPARVSLGRFAASPDFVDEVLQELRSKLLLPPDPRIARYSGRGPLAAWIRVAASRTAIDLLRAAHGGAAPDPTGPDGIGQVDLGPEVQLLREVYREAFQTALADALRALEPRDRNLLRRHMVERMTLEEIAGPYGVHPATIARRLATLRDQIGEAVRQRLAARHRAEGGSTSLESLAYAIRSELHVSLSPLLARDSSSSLPSASSASELRDTADDHPRR
jgi:RNA polymerase sigma-70 factor (ECF subfamily)